MRGGETRGDGGRQSDASFDSRAEDIHFVKNYVDDTCHLGGEDDHHAGSRRRRRHESTTTPRSLRATCARARDVMPARGGGAASRDAARRVAEDLLRLTLDPGPAPRVDSEDAGSGASVVGDARDASPERAVAALERLYASESYEDVRSAVVSALPRVRHPARFALACIERLAGGVDGAPRGPAPLVRLLAEALARSGPSLSRRAPRREFDATNEDATRLHDEIALGSAASLVLRAVRGAMRDATAGPPISDSRPVGRDDARERDGFRAEPRAVAKLAVASGVDLDDLRAAATREDRTGTRGDATPVRALVWYVGACLGGCFKTRARILLLLLRALVDDRAAPPRCSRRRPSRGTSPSTSSPPPPRWTRSSSRATARWPTASPRASPRAARGVRERRLSETFAESSSEPTRRRRSAPSARVRRAGLAPAASSFAITREARAREEARLRALCADGRWDLAAALAGSDPGLRDAARRFRADASSEGHRASIPLSRVGRRSFLALDLPASSVLWCATLPALREAAERLAGDERIGLDSEWRPEGRDEDEDLSASASRRRRPRARRDALGAPRRSFAALRRVRRRASGPPGARERAGGGLGRRRRLAFDFERAEESGARRRRRRRRERKGRREIIAAPGPRGSARARTCGASRDRTRAPSRRRFATRRASWTCARRPVRLGPSGAHPPGLAALQGAPRPPLDKSQTTSDWEARPLTPRRRVRRAGREGAREALPASRERRAGPGRSRGPRGDVLRRLRRGIAPRPSHRTDARAAPRAVVFPPRRFASWRARAATAASRPS